MGPVVLDNIRGDVDIEHLVKKLSVANKEVLGEAENLLNDALQIARPKAMYKTAYITQHGNDFVIIEDIIFNSRILRINLDNIFRAFPYIVTSGLEIDSWVNSQHDALTRYLADAISECSYRV